MKKIIGSIPLILASLIPFAASAHQHATFQIGGTQYDFVVGSTNEPLVVDDKTSIDLKVSSGGHLEKSEDGDMEPAGGVPTEGLENDLKVELIAGDKKKTVSLSPIAGTPGSYGAPFYPTIPTTLSYRFFGKVHDTPVDLTFTCSPHGADAVHEDEKEISAGVKQVMKMGNFDCPATKESLGFPEAAPSLATLSGSVTTLSKTTGSLSDATESTKNIALTGLVAGLAGLLLGGIALMRRKSA